jgi:hypothetical protein
MTQNSSPQPTHNDALADIRKRKAEIKCQINESAKLMKEDFNSLFAPAPKPASRFGNILGMVDNGVAIFDGLLLGMKVVRSIRRIFGKRK